MKKKILALLLAVATASMFAGCGKDDGGRERESREESSYEQEESAPESVSEPEEPEEAPLLTSVYASAKPGNEFQFGAYEQDNNLSDGAEPIEWVVLANEGDRILVLSKYVLRPEELKNGEIKDDIIPDDPYSHDVTWEVSAERKWLNSIFYEEAFSDEERSCILQSELKTPDMDFTAYLNDRDDTLSHSYGGADTTDYLFLLSCEEFKEYVKPLKIEHAELMGASVVESNEETEYVDWLLRSPYFAFHDEGYAGYADKFMKVDSKRGDITYTYTSRDGKERTDLSGGGRNVLRMAMWLKVE